MVTGRTKGGGIRDLDTVIVEERGLKDKALGVMVQIIEGLCISVCIFLVLIMGLVGAFIAWGYLEIEGWIDGHKT